NSASVGLVAAFILAIFPPQLNYVRWIMSEMPTIFFLLGAYYFYYKSNMGGVVSFSAWPPLCEPISAPSLFYW
ncbi:MAG: hypothetical protein ABUM51_00275, partial [Bacteroidota bacterium]